jgi:uncharacterized delta-60 repeat protein
VRRLRELFGPAAAALIVVATIWVAAPADATPGDRDAFFDDDGVATVFPNGAIATAVALDHHERILVVGYTLRREPDLALARLTPAGRLDPTFGGDGKVVTDLGGNDYAFDVAIEADGGIVVAGERDGSRRDRVAVARYLPNGTLDGSFGGDGVVLTTFGRRFQSASAVGLMPDGRIVVAGFTSNGTTGRSAVARYRPDGSLDRTFGDDGRVTTDLSPSGERFEDVAVLPGGAIVAAGHAESGLIPRFSAARYRVDGSLDDRFGRRGAGYTRIDVAGGSDIAHAVAVLPGGRLILAGYTSAGSRDEWAVVRLGPNGRLDEAFGGDGRVVSSFSEGYESAFGVAIQPNGKVLIVGRVHGPETREDLAVWRLKPRGGPDLAFGEAGLARIDVFGGADTARAAALQANGKLVVAGECVRSGDRRFAVARLLTR